MKTILGLRRHHHIRKRELKKLFSVFFLTLFLIGTVSLALGIEQPFAQALMAQSEVTGGLHVLEYYFCTVPTETVYVSSEPRSLSYHAHIQLRSVGGQLYETSLNATEIVDMPSTMSTGIYAVQPSPTSNGSNWFYWDVGVLKETIYFDDMFHIQWDDRERTTLESLGFSMSRNLTTHEIQAEKDIINQTIFIEIRPVERDKILWASAEYMQNLISVELLEYNYKDNVVIPSASRPYYGGVEWRINPPLEEVYVFQATFKLTRKPGVAGIVEAFPNSRAWVRVQTQADLPSAKSVITSFEVGNLRMSNRDSVRWTLGHEKGTMLSFDPREATIHHLTISSTTGGNVTAPGEGTLAYDTGTQVDLVATPGGGYRFVNWTGDVGTIRNVNAATTTITMNGDYSITANFEEIPPPPSYPTVTTQAASDITTDSTTVNMNYTVGNFSPVQVRFDYKKSTDSAWFSTDWVSRAVDGTYATSLAELDSGTQYDFKAQLRYEGTVTEGTTLQFTTTAPTSTGECFIATAAYGTPMAEEIQILREFRDEYLLTNPLGQGLVDVYYRISPPIADFMTDHPSLKPIVRAALMPVVGMCSIVLNMVPQFTGSYA